MGAVMAVPVVTIQWLINESTRILNTTSTIIAITSVVVVGYVSDLADRAEHQIRTIFLDVDDFLKDLAAHGEHARQCISNKRADLDRIRAELIESLVKCYTPQQETLRRLQNDRLELQDEAKKLRAETEAIVARCSGDIGTKYTCLKKGLMKLSRRTTSLVNRVDNHKKRELSQRQNNILQVMACDRKAVERAYHAVQTIIKEIKTCIFSPEIERAVPFIPNE